jgi:RsiW-degrading membrane proteinase PrsW (M82 family)
MNATALLLLLFSIVAASVPLIALLAVLVWMDRYEREPIWLVAITFLWGAVGAIFFALFASVLFLLPAEAFLDPASIEAVGAVLVAPLVEEPAKGLVLLFLVASKHFDNPTDGIVYGAAAGLGFGMTENFFYFAEPAASGEVGSWIGLVFIRTLFSAPMHACATGLLGMALGFAKFRGWRQRVVVVPLGLAAAVGLHMMWNGLAVLSSTSPQGGLLFLLNLLLLIGVFALMMASYQFSLWRESKLILRELNLLAQEGVLPEEQAHHLSSWTSRALKKDWVPPQVPKKAYIEAATLFAFRMAQSRARPEQVFYREEAARLRTELEEFLARAVP